MWDGHLTQAGGCGDSKCSGGHTLEPNPGRVSWRGEAWVQVVPLAPLKAE